MLHKLVIKMEDLGGVLIVSGSGKRGHGALFLVFACWVGRKVRMKVKEAQVSLSNLDDEGVTQA